ncbi:MAG: mannose-1-phosphate guanylyltransferase [Planctomycetota bacterium]
MLYAVILAGGSGTRFWPASRKKRPKQFLQISGSEADSLLTATCERLKGAVSPERIFVVTSISQRDECAKQLPGIPLQNIIGEPAPRGTAAAIGYIASRLNKIDPVAGLIILPADHLVSPVDKFIQTLTVCARVASKGDYLVTIGIKPAYPATGYGYIKCGGEFADIEGSKAYSIAEFKEKPDLTTAKSYLESGNYYWNSGMFIFKATSILTAIEKHLPQLNEALLKIKSSVATRHEEAVTLKEYYALDTLSIDKGILEKADNVKIVESAFEWNDVGSWLSLESTLEKDSDGNAVKGDVASVESKNLIAVSDGGVIAAVGVSDLIIVHTPDATLVCSKENAEKVREIVKKMEDGNLKQYL